MNEKYFGIDPQCARQLLSQVKTMTTDKRGIDRQAFLFDSYAVLSTKRLKLRNVDTRDDDLAYFDEIMEALMDLRSRGVAVVPILGYCYDPDSADGTGYVFQQRAKGNELYDDGAIARFQAWTQTQGGNSYLRSSMPDAEAAEYLLFRTYEISQVPQWHFDKLIADMFCILEKDLLIDCLGTSNFFYDKDVGFQFIDLDSHNDYRYGLADQKPNIQEIVSLCGFTPCHKAAGTTAFAPVALAEQALQILTADQRAKLGGYNCAVFQKCFTALKNNNIPGAYLNKSLEQLKIYGC